jgi:hypothetical protein
MKIESKSILAKLLATENISVQQDNIPTAAFDVKKRVLYIPNWKDMSNSLQDLLIGHEVGHAFETPSEGWHDAICEDSTLKGYLNVIEDARIERKVKTRYPGLVKSFFSGYRELFERDFFGVKDMDVNTLPLIDRINLHFKVGTYLNIEFSKTEQSFVNRCEKTETWEDVEALARELHDKAKEEAEDNIEDLLEQFQNDSGDDDEEDSFGEGAGESSDSEEDSELESGFSGDAESDEFDQLFSDEEDETPVSVKKFVEDGGVGSITDSEFREKEQQLINTSETKKKVYLNIPRFDLNRIIIPAKKVYKMSDVSLYTWNRTVDTTPEEMAANLYKEFMAKNSKTVNQMAANFEMKRKASLYVKAKTSKTGDLDDKKLWSYKTSENLFKQITSIPDGKNHGMIMYLDMSGSMFNNMPGTIDQLVNLSMFCRKINIPFEVYGFTTSYARYDEPEISYQEKIAGDISLADVKIVHLLSSSFNKRQNEEAYKYLLLWKQSFLNRLTRSGSEIVMNNQNIDLAATPLNSTIVIGIEIAKQFREAHKVEILNTIFLTDGDATDFVDVYQEYKWREDEDETKIGSHRVHYNEQPIFKYGGTTMPLFSTDVIAHRNAVATSTLIELYKDVTGSKVINFHLLSSWSKNQFLDCKDYNLIGHSDFDFIKWDQLIASQKSSGVIEVKDPFGFDVRYIVKGGKSLNLEEQDLEVKSNSKGDLLRGFRKYASSKSQSRVFVQKFIPEIA